MRAANHVDIFRQLVVGGDPRTRRAVLAHRCEVVLDIDERVAWYVAAFNFVRNLPQNVVAEDKSEKIKRLRTLHERLRHLKQSDRNA